MLQGEQDIYANTPNWFYYWRKGGVIEGIGQFRYEDDPLWCGHYYFEDDRLVLSRGAFDAWNMSWQVTNPYRATITAGANGIVESYAQSGDVQLVEPLKKVDPYTPIISCGPDEFLSPFYLLGLGGDDELDGEIHMLYNIKCDRLMNVALTIKHEMTHRMLRFDLTDQVPCPWQNIPPTADYDYVHDTIREALKPYWLHPEVHDSYDMDSVLPPKYVWPWRSDQEFLAYMSEMGSDPVISESTDWTRDGRQWRR